LNTPPGNGTVLIADSGLTGLPSSATGAFASRHPAGANFAFGDGHVRFLSSGIDLATYQALSTMAGFEPVDASKFEAAP